MFLTLKHFALIQHLFDVHLHIYLDARFCYAVNVLHSCSGLGMTRLSTDHELVSVLAK